MRVPVIITLVFSLLLISSKCSNTINKFTFSPEENTIDTILHSKALSPVFEELTHLKNQEKNSFSVMHIGDSHIEIGQFSGEIKRQLQESYGAGEVGWMFPYQLFNSQSSKVFPMDTTGTWKRMTIKNPEATNILGVTGLGFYLEDNQGSIHFTSNQSYKDVKKVAFLHFYNGKSINFNTSKGKIETQQITPHTAITTIHFDQDSDKKIHFTNENQLVIYAIKLNPVTSKGISYHKFGVAGSTLDQFMNNTPLFMEQVAYFKPNLLIVSLGTNDSYIDTLNENRLDKQLTTFIQDIQHQSPTTSLLFTTAPDTKYRNNRPQRLTEINRIIRNNVEKNQKVALWDLHQIMGGDYSVNAWNKKHLLNNDILHFTPKGYQLQGELFMHAFDKANPIRK